MDNEVIVSVNKAKRNRNILKTVKIALLIILLLLIILYFVVGFIYNNGNFSITLDKNLYFDNNLIIYDDTDYKVFRTELYADSISYFDNISYKWLPSDLNDHDGSHNGENYIAYTFYIENMGEDTSDYWSELIIDDVIKNVDEAVRIRVYINGEPTTYAKLSKTTGKPEKYTVPFTDDNLVIMSHVQNFKPGDINKYTIVVWLEGSDPDCNNNILGGEIKMHMEFNSEFVDK